MIAGALTVASALAARRRDEPGNRRRHGRRAAADRIERHAAGRHRRRRIDVPAAMVTVRDCAEPASVVSRATAALVFVTVAVNDAPARRL